MVARSRIAVALTCVSALALTGCVSSVANSSGVYANPTGTAPVTTNETPYSAALVCLAGYARSVGRPSPRIAVGRINDRTGRDNSDGSGRFVTQGASDMAMSALAKAGAIMVNRYDTSVSEMDLKYANNNLISDDPNAVRGRPNDSRKIYQGQIAGSDFNITGAITEANFNIRSVGADAAGGKATSTGLKARLGSRIMVMNVAIDLQVNDTISQEIVDVISYQKQLVAHEYGVGLFTFLNGNTFDASAGTGAMEPTGLAVRAMIERAMVEVMANFYGAPGPEVCMKDDPLAGVRTAGISGGYTPAYNNLGTNNAQTRDDPNRWHVDRDSDVPQPRLRGRY